MSVRGRNGQSEAGQALVEFALTLPVLFLLIVGFIELSLAFNARNTVFFASRDGSMLAAEGGAIAGTDCIVLDRVERDVVSPADAVRVQTVKIFWSDKNGVQIGNEMNVYTRSGSLTCTYGDGSSVTVPYTLTTGDYLESERCDVLAGCGGSHTAPDNIGVAISYRHNWVTAFLDILGGAVTFTQTAATRIEPQK